MKTKKTYPLSELAELSGVTPRTLRYYISRGLLPGPEKAGRGATYNDGHLARVREIQSLQAEGLTLAGIARRLAPEAPEELSPAPGPLLWRHYPVAEDVMVMVREDTGPWRLRSVRTAIVALRKELEGQKNTREE